MITRKGQQIYSCMLLFFISICGCKKSMTLEGPTTPSQKIVICSQQSNKELLRLTSSCDIPIQHFENVFLRDTSIDEILVNHIFKDVLGQGSSLCGKYFSDGQFAYSNNIRRYIESTYNVPCNKLFVFGDLTVISPRYGCEASWKYDVACVIRGKEDYVIDPRLFDKVVSVSTWIQRHTLMSEFNPRIMQLHSEIVPGAVFTPLDAVPSGYLVDSNYVYTDVMIEYYKDSVGCAGSETSNDVAVK